MLLFVGTPKSGSAQFFQVLLNLELDHWFRFHKPFIYIGTMGNLFLMVLGLKWVTSYRNLVGLDNYFLSGT